MTTIEFAETLDLQHQSELAALRRMLVVGQGTFSLSVAVCNSPALRSRLIDFVREQFSAFEIVTIPPQTIDVYDFVRGHAPIPGSAIFLVGLEASISNAESDDVALHSLNASRDLWAAAFHCPVVFWLPEYAARVLSETARDFWRIRSHRFYFVKHDNTPTYRQPDSYLGRYLTATSLSEDEKRTRIEELQQRIAQTDSSSPSMQMHILSWWEELASLNHFLGNLEEALRIHLEEVLPIFEQQGDVLSRATVLRQIADILRRRGASGDALRILREEVVPVFERHDVAGSRALAMGQIADILESRGDLDEALRIHREEELPVYEQLGDARSRAMTMGNIAGILQMRGDLDEALRIYREEELPVYGRLGDVWSRAVTMGNVANILKSRGELDEALHIHREEELPVYARLGDVRSWARAMGSIAGILQSRGELEEAFRIRREDVLPAFERLGDPRLIAVEKGNIAEILRLRGELSESLRLLRDEVLPAYGRIGDARGLAVCQFNTSLLFLKRNQGADRRRAKELLTEALHAVERMKIPEAEQIRLLMQRERFLK